MTAILVIGTVGAYLLVAAVVSGALIGALGWRHPDFCARDCLRCAAAIDLAIAWPLTLAVWGLRRLVHRLRSSGGVPAVVNDEPKRRGDR